MKRHAFTLIELLTGMIVLIIIAGVSTLSFNIGKQTPKKEAEKLMSRLHNMMQQAGRRHQNFTMTVNVDNVAFIWNKAGASKKELTDKSYEVSKGLTLAPNFGAANNTLSYSYSENDFNHQGGHILIKDEKGNECKIVIAVEGGRITISDDVS